MTTTRRRALCVALALAAGLAACGDGGGGDTDDGVASIDGDAAEQAADGGGGDGDGGGGRSGQGRDPEFEDAMLEYAQCMRDNGVDMPDPEFGDDGSVSIRAEGGPGAEGGSGGEDADFEAAEEECSPIMEEARPEVDIDPEEQAEMQDRMLEVAQCMREKGHDMPDPEFTDDGGVLMRSGPPGGGEGGEGPGPEFEADMEDCQDEAGVEGPGGGGFGASRSDG